MVAGIFYAVTRVLLCGGLVLMYVCWDALGGYQGISVAKVF